MRPHGPDHSTIESQTTHNVVNLTRRCRHRPSRFLPELQTSCRANLIKIRQALDQVSLIKTGQALDQVNHIMTPRHQDTNKVGSWSKSYTVKTQYLGKFDLPYNQCDRPRRPGFEIRM